MVEANEENKIGEQPQDDHLTTEQDDTDLFIEVLNKKYANSIKPIERRKGAL
jgi:hypothetical protein